MSTMDYTDHSSSVSQEIFNKRAASRNVPSQSLQPYLDARPVNTKYSILPIVDARRQISTPLNQEATYNINHTFNPGNAKGPWSGYASNVNHESELRSQIYGLQSCSQATYVPSSKSNLYQYHWKNSQNKQIPQPFPQLFQTDSFCDFNPNPNSDKIGYSLFNNATRQQLKDLTKPTPNKQGNE